MMETFNDHGFTDKIFSWSLEDILNENLFKVEKIPESFESVAQYLQSYAIPLLEETRAQLHSSMGIISSAPFGEVIVFSECKPSETLLYDVKVDYWRNRFNDHGKEPYKILPGDFVVLADAKPEIVSDLRRIGRTWTCALVTSVTENNDSALTSFKVKAPKELKISGGIKKSLFVIFLRNITTNKRIWDALHMLKNLNFINKVLCADSAVAGNCGLCSIQGHGIWDEKFVMNLSSKLNESQAEAAMACLHTIQCNHRFSLELIWGPPGTGKTTVVSMLLFTLLRMKRRTLICAPTNVAIVEVASKVLKLVAEYHEAESGTDALSYSKGHILLFGNKEILNINAGIEEIYLDYHVQRLKKCLENLTGWLECFTSMIDFLEDCVSYYSILENELDKVQEHNHENENKEKNFSDGGHKSFLEFVRERFQSVAFPLKNYLFVFQTCIPESYILKQNIQNITSLLGMLDSFESLLFNDDLISKDLVELFSHQELVENSFQGCAETVLLLCLRRRECLSALTRLRSSLSELKLPSLMDMGSIEDSCFRTASLFFCTVSNSYKMHSLAMESVNVLVIDDAAQVKECESAIPLQLPGIRHAILIGDECQLPAMLESNVSDEAGFGRSLFERLSSMGHPKHLLKMQYRMHPSITCFPNSTFYCNQILDAPNVRSRSHEKSYLPGRMFGPYSFINIFGGREELNDAGHSRRNMVEVAVVLKVVSSLYKAWKGSEEKLRIGVISPYAAQVVAIEEKLGQRYENINGFSVKVNSVERFQGGEEDIVIISTVRSNIGGGIRFMSNPRIVNVALTRARRCLWILGSEGTLCNSESVWEVLVRDAKERQCFFNVDEDKELANTILEVKKEFDQLDDLLNGDSAFLRNSRWKVLFSDCFRKSFGKLASVRIKTYVLNVLLKLSSGWRPKRRSVDSICEKSSQILKQFKVEGLYIICSIDIVKEMRYIQVLKVWDILPLEDIPGLVNQLDCIFGTYNDDFIRHCKEKCQEGDLEVPKTWSITFNIVRHKNHGYSETGSSSSGYADSQHFVENSRVSDSLLLMKFYSLSSGSVRHLLSDCDGRELILPFEVSDEEKEIIQFPKSTFIMGRSGTGKTTVLTMKLAEKEQLYRMAMEGSGEVNENTTNDYCWRNNFDDGVGYVEGSVRVAKKTFLCQLFVTVSPKLCYAVKHHVSQLKSFASGGNYSARSSSVNIEDIDDTELFKDIPDSFVDIPPKSFPLVITFYKFLMMLDGTVGNSYFERFHCRQQFLIGQGEISGSIALHTFIKTREVNYDKFCSVYWPHFNVKLTKLLDSSRVFTEIMTHIKVGLQTGKSYNGALSQEDYVKLSEDRISTLSLQEREIIYDIFKAYEKMKIKNGDFDMADLVIDLHHRLKNERYKGDIMDFVYIDEVQDLTMSQIALFKHICKNVSEGFVFSGDTAQTIAKGIDFRFEDIRSLFYNEFVLGSRSTGNGGRNEKGQLSKILHLIQNFRTHAGVLKLAQSIIDLLYHFFPLAVDKLSNETSLIFGEAPIFIVPENDENGLPKIFGNNCKAKGNFVGFGAEQVILVRDDSVRKEVSHCVGNQALILTILECKGLEFQDVLLYNFFGSSHLMYKWRAVYEYMKEHDLLDSNSSGSFSRFDLGKHYGLCSELKQLYVAITRTRQRLWILENREEFSKPILDYWKKKKLVQVRKLDDSFAQAMQVASSLEDWQSRGDKLFAEKNYEMAMMCFARAGDKHREKLAMATGLKATADKMHGSDPKIASSACRQAAEIFESIGKLKSAAECFYMLKEYKRAGSIYLECGESVMKMAGECFCLAGCYERAAEVYARGNYFSMCLSACTKGKLFDLGLKYIQSWKQQATADGYTIGNSRTTDKIEQEFLESCALHYHKRNDSRAMMRYVREFYSMATMRTFLQNLGYLDELLSLEEENGNFLEAANIARLKGEPLLESQLLEKAGYSKDASMLILWYVFVKSLWSSGSKGWPLKQFAQKEELLSKAKSLARNVSNQCYEIVCTEAEVLLNDQSSLCIMKQHLNDCQRHKIIRGEIILSRKILDAHLGKDASQYGWENDLVHDQARLSEDKFSNNQVSVQTLFYSWNFWKDKIVNIFEDLGSLAAQDSDENGCYGEFCLNYLGVQRQSNNVKAVYLLMNFDAYWVRELNPRVVRSKRRRSISIDVHQLVSAAQSYWRSELLSVAMNVLINLEALYNFATMNSLSLFCQSSCLTHIYEVANFLLNSNFMDHRCCNRKELQKFIGLSTQQFFCCIYPLDWRESLRENMISLRRTEVSRNLLEEVILENVSLQYGPSYEQLGRLALIILGSDKRCYKLFEKIAGCLKWNPSWKAFIKKLCKTKEEFFPGRNIKAPGKLSLTWMLHQALVDTYNANRMADDYISLGCFLYLVERQLILVSYSQGYFLTTASSFIEWHINQEASDNLTSSLMEHASQLIEGILEFVLHIVQQLLYNLNYTMKWTEKSHKNVKDHDAVVVLRLTVILCLVYLNFGLCRGLLSDLLRRNSITSQLPRKFYNALCRSQKHNFLDANVLAAAFKMIGNPLVIVRLGDNFFRYFCPDAISVDMNVQQSKDDILRVLLMRINEAAKDDTGDVEVKTHHLCTGIVSPNSHDQGNRTNLLSSNVGSVAKLHSNTREINEGNLPFSHGCLWKMFETLLSMNHGQDRRHLDASGPAVKEDRDRNIHLLSAANAIEEKCLQKRSPDVVNYSQFEEAVCMINELRQLYAAMEVRKLQPRNDISTFEGLLKKLQSRRPRMEAFLNQILV